MNSRSGSVPVLSTSNKDVSLLDSQKQSASSPLKLDLSLKSSERKLSPTSSALVGLTKRDHENREGSSRPRSASPKDRESNKSREGYRPSSSATVSEKLGIYGTSSHLSSNSSSNTHVTSAHLNGLTKPEASLSSLAGGISPYPPHLLLPGYPTLNGYALPGGLTSASTAAILAAHKHNPESVRYTSVKTASGATTLVPVCSDPYCTYCKLTLQSAQLAPACGSGCAQCTSDKAAVGLSASYPSTSLASSLLGMSSLHGLSAAYGSPSSHGSAAGHYVCSWIGTAGFCGKRFASSEELVQHLRSHTATLDTPAPTLPTGLPLSSLASHGLASHLYPSAALGSVSPSSLRQPYPRSLSPTLLAASRFHPYLKSSLSSLPSALDSSSLPPVHPSLGAYSSLYSLYGHKLGVP